MRRLWTICSLAVLAMFSIAIAPAAWAQGTLDEAIVLIEINATDGDAGFHGLADGEGWTKIQLTNPDGKKLYKGKAKKALQEQGITEFFFESSEPSCDDVPLTEFLLRFPEGVYSYEVKTTTKDKLSGADTLTHDLPAEPEILEPEQGEDAEEDPPEVGTQDATLSWDEGEDLGECDVEGIEPGGEIVGYEVVAEPGDDEIDDFRIWTIQLPADVMSVDVSPEYLESYPDGTLFKFEILAIEASGNRTATEGFFATAE